MNIGWILTNLQRYIFTMEIYILFATIKRLSSLLLYSVCKENYDIFEDGILKRL